MGPASDEFDLKLGWPASDDRDEPAKPAPPGYSLASSPAAVPDVVPAADVAAELVAVQDELRAITGRLGRLETEARPQIAEFGDVLERVTRRVADITLQFNELVRQLRAHAEAVDAVKRSQAEILEQLATRNP